MRPFVISCLVAAGFAGAAASLQAQGASLSNAEWKSTSLPAGGALSNGDKTLTLQLPAASQITALISIPIVLTFSSTQGSNHVMIPVNSNKPGTLFCFELPPGTLPTSGSRKKETPCKIEVAWAKAITSDQTVTITVAATNGNRTLTAIIKPYTGPNSVASIQTVSSTIRPGDLATFRVKLMSAVPTGQTQAVGWGLTPRECFENASQSSPYSPTWTLTSVNLITFQPGESQRDVTVKVASSGSCVGANRLMETWSPVTPNVQSTPTYRSHAFTVSPLVRGF